MTIIVNIMGPTTLLLLLRPLYYRTPLDPFKGAL